MPFRTTSLFTLLAIVLVAVHGNAQQPARRRAAGARCTSSAVIVRATQRFFERDARALDAAVADAMTRAGLTAVPVPSIERSFEEPVTAEPRVIVARPVDAAQPDGATIATRATPDGAIHVMISGPMVMRGGCRAPEPRPDDFRVGRRADGRLIPVHIVFRDVAVPFRSCGCTGGCGTEQPPLYAWREIELPVADETLVAAPITLRVVRHRISLVGTETCALP